MNLSNEGYNQPQPQLQPYSGNMFQVGYQPQPQVNLSGLTNPFQR